MMDLLNNLMGGGQNRQEYEDYVNRYDQGSPYDGISDREAYDRYQRIAPQLPPDVYQQSAEDAFSRMSPQDRQQFGQYLRQQSRQQGYNIPDLDRDGVDDRMEDPRHLAQVMGNIQQQQPGLLQQMLGGQQQSMGGAGNMLSNPLAKAALGGIAAMALKRMMSGGSSGLGSLGGLGGTTRRNSGGGFGGVDM